MMTIKPKAIYYRITDRDANIAFFTQKLGMRLISEENELTFLGAMAKANSQVILEEAPDWLGNRAVIGTKKHELTSIRTKGYAIEQLLLRQDREGTRLFKGKNSYAFIAKSPQGDPYLLHDEDDISQLLEIKNWPSDIVADEAFSGLDSWEYTGLTLNTPQPSVSRAFYDIVFEGHQPFEVYFNQAFGRDLLVEPKYVYDIDVIAYQVSSDVSLATMKKRLEETLNLSVYLNQKETLLVVREPSHLELWLMK